SKTEYSASRVVVLHDARTSTLSPSNSGVISPICCRKTTVIGNGDHQIGLIFLLLFPSREKGGKETYLHADCLMFRS
ncbi:MAG TPA: hypothetical protein VFI06_13435, partial [Chitinophagaceae bacterium]|nr:hypothetical protein [Chitinophagaceae bacterium]